MNNKEFCETDFDVRDSLYNFRFNLNALPLEFMNLEHAGIYSHHFFTNDYERNRDLSNRFSLVIMSLNHQISAFILCTDHRFLFFSQMSFQPFQINFLYIFDSF